MQIRLATPADAPAINAIYRPSVTEGVASFELTPPSDAEMAERIRGTLVERPWLVYVDGGEVRGYAYAGRHQDRPAYQWSVNVSVYVHASMRGRGVGSVLYRELFLRLADQGYYNAYAGITLPNVASVALHESFGFLPVGVYRNVGFKLGRWWDVGWWQKRIAPHTVPTHTPDHLGKNAPSVL